MKLNKTVPILLIILVSFLLYYLLFFRFEFIMTGLNSFIHQGLTSYILTYLIIGIPIFLGTYFLNKTSIFKSLGLSKNIFIGIGAGLLFSLPMFVGGFIYFKLNHQIDFQNLIAGTLVAGFMEELYFRGFLFGQIFKNTNLGFIPAIFLQALIFASSHLWQSQDMNEVIGIFSITFFGAIFFAWLYTEWKFNLWVAIFTHTLMNLSWNLFDVDTTALGDMKANIFRGLTILIAVVFTIVYKKRTHQDLIINRDTLWMKKKDILESEASVNLL